MCASLMACFEEVQDAVDVQDAVACAHVIFHPAMGIDETAVAQVQAALRRRILRAFVGRALIEPCDAKAMQAYAHSGFSVDAGVCIEAHDRAALERLLRYCARPTLYHGSAAQRGQRLGVPLRQTQQRTCRRQAGRGSSKGWPEACHSTQLITHESRASSQGL